MNQGVDQLDKNRSRVSTVRVVDISNKDETTNGSCGPKPAIPEKHNNANFTGCHKGRGFCGFFSSQNP
jgi:hypothetical protein